VCAIHIYGKYINLLLISVSTQNSRLCVTPKQPWGT